jgi:hypothetical protein
MVEPEADAQRILSEGQEKQCPCVHSLAPSYMSSLFKNSVLKFILCVFCLHVHLCTTCMPGVQRGQKMESGPLELELTIVVSCHMDAEN